MKRTRWILAGLALACLQSTGCRMFCDRYCERENERNHPQQRCAPVPAACPPGCAPVAGGVAPPPGTTYYSQPPYCP